MENSKSAPVTQKLSVLDRVIGIVVKLMDIEPGFLTAASPLNVLDAVEVLNLMSGLHKEFGLNVSDVDVSKCTTLGDVAHMVTVAQERRNNLKMVGSALAPEKQADRERLLNIVNCPYNKIEFVKLPYRQTYDIKLNGRRVFVDDVNVAGYKIQIITMDDVEKFRSVNGVPADNHAIIRTIFDACAYRYQKER